MRGLQWYKSDNDDSFSPLFTLAVNYLHRAARLRWPHRFRHFHAAHKLRYMNNQWSYHLFSSTARDCAKRFNTIVTKLLISFASAESQQCKIAPYGAINILHS